MFKYYEKLSEEDKKWLEEHKKDLKNTVFEDIDAEYKYLKERVENGEQEYESVGDGHKIIDYRKIKDAQKEKREEAMKVAELKKIKGIKGKRLEEWQMLTSEQRRLYIRYGKIN